MTLTFRPDQMQVLRNERGEANAYAYRQQDGELLTVLNGVVLGVPSVDDEGNLVFSDPRLTDALPVLATRAVTRDAVMSEITEDTPINAFLAWSPGMVVAVDDVLAHGDVLYRVVQAHTTQADWTPDATPALFARYFDSADGPQPWVQPQGAHDAYNTGDRVVFEGSVYESLIDANVWSPAAHPAGWQLIE